MPRSEWRTLLTLAAALVLPLVIFVALQGAFTMRIQRLAIEQDAAARARQINAEVDGQLWADRSALEVLTTSQFVVSRNWRGAYDRFKGIAADRPRWKNIMLTDAETGQELFETRSAFGAPKAPRPSIAAYLAARRTAAQFDGVAARGPGCPCITLHVPVIEKDALVLLLTVEIGVEDFQAILKSHAPDPGVSAIVDRQGRFIARTLDPANRVGKPATIYVRQAIRTGTSGLYRGYTYEGLKSISSFDTSHLSGWSTHIALSANRLSAPITAAWLLTGASALLVLMLAAVLSWFALRRLAEQRREMEQRAQSQKLAAIGQLASGVAHDFNNLLMVISGSLQLIGKRSSDPTLAKPLKNAQDAADRGAVLTRQLLDFARAGPAEMAAVDLSEMLERMSGLLSQSLGPAIGLTVDIEPTTPRVVSNASQLELALINLAVNARDAMPDGGVLTITGRPSRESGFVDLTIRDNGQGMPAHVRDRALEPFFTTKPVGKGTGLGLAQVFGIVAQSGGTVTLQSEVGDGATVTLTLPVA